MSILVTGGAGYIGSHTLIELINNNHTPVVIDNLSNASTESIQRVERITGKKVIFHEGSVEDAKLLADLFTSYTFDAVIHFAGLKAVGESVDNPLKYYDVNLNSSITLLQTMLAHNVTTLVFSSSATVYGTPQELPLTEESPTGSGITNPYGQTKYMIEQIITDTAAAHPHFSATILRYFNPIGAHESGLIGEDPNDTPNNLLPYISQVAVGKLEKLGVFGDDYDTVDGTGVRDYIHVVDLARGHLAALQNTAPGTSIYNLGTGKGTSVFELISHFKKASNRPIPYEIKARRAGDIASCYADPSKAKRELGWEATLSIEKACKDAWRWQHKNPNGYKQ